MVIEYHSCKVLFNNREGSLSLAGISISRLKIHVQHWWILYFDLSQDLADGSLDHYCSLLNVNDLRRPKTSTPTSACGTTSWPDNTEVRSGVSEASREPASQRQSTFFCRRNRYFCLVDACGGSFEMQWWEFIKVSCDSAQHFLQKDAFVSVQVIQWYFH